MEYNRIKVSIIVPVYNVEKYLDRCLTSLLKQTLKEVEIILVDDGSPDNSGEICDDYAKKYSNVKVIHKENEGLGYTRNSGLEIASGEFVGFIDSDDFIDTKMYEDLYLFAKQNMLDTAFSAGFKYYNNGKIEEKPEVIKETFWEYDKICECFIPDIIGAPPTYHSDVKYAMSVCRGIYSLKQIRNNNIKFVSEREFLSEDILFNIEYLIKSKKIGMVPKCYYYYCYNEESLTRSYRPDIVERMHVLYREITNKIEEYNLPDSTNLNLNRLYLSMIRHTIQQEICFKEKNLCYRKRKMQAIINDSILNGILKSYPYLDLPYKHKIFFLLLRFRLVFVLTTIYKTPFF